MILRYHYKNILDLVIRAYNLSNSPGSMAQEIVVMTDIIEQEIDVVVTIVSHENGYWFSFEFDSDGDTLLFQLRYVG